ncbi:hypothetical protein Ancab_007262 [Ancistrocladus abbreviatus]
MEDQCDSASLTRSSKLTSRNPRKSATVVAPVPKAFQQKTFKHIGSQNHGTLRNGVACDVALFFVKVAALETVRRFSRARCPFAWRCLQGVQVLRFPPFKWIQRWAPFRGLVKGIQMFSQPLLVLSIATAFTDSSEQVDASNGLDDSNECSSPDSKSPPVENSVDARLDDNAPELLLSEDWLQNLYKELENQGINLPERINENELHRFYTAANGDFPCLLATVKKTVHWRETYYILSEQELALWSNVVFWHGCDMRDRPCLVIRLGLACVSLPFHDRPRFAQAVVSQIEYGILQFVDEENPQVTVLVDCEGLSPLKLPMQIMRSCIALFQDHFPNRLACLFVIRLPPVVRMIAQTFIQVLKPATRQKLKFAGETYQVALSEYLQSLPAYLGGKCVCCICSSASINDMQNHCPTRMASETRLDAGISDGDDLPAIYPTSQADLHLDYNHVLRTGIMAILMFWAFIAFCMGIYDRESRPFASR